MLNLCLLMFQLSLARYTGEDELSKARMQVLVVLCSKPMQVRLAAFSLRVLYCCCDFVSFFSSFQCFRFDKVCKILKDLYMCR